MPAARRLPTRDELAMWREFIEATDLLRTAVATRLHDDTGLSTGDYTVLLALAEAAGGRYRSSDLATAIGWERSRLSHHLGRMERRGLIRREHCTDDSRGAEIVLEPHGKQAFDAATKPHLRAVRELFVEALTPDQVKAAGDVAAALRRHLSTTSRPGSGFKGPGGV
jgi:DNA-binding MarR family transcriptional regulator